MGSVQLLPCKRACFPERASRFSSLSYCARISDLPLSFTRACTGVVVLVKFNPKDIVSVPSDCNCEKMRVSSYEVISVAREQLEEAVYSEDEYYDDQEDYLDELQDGDVINDSW